MKAITRPRPHVVRTTEEGTDALQIDLRPSRCAQDDAVTMSWRELAQALRERGWLGESNSIAPDAGAQGSRG